MNLHYVNVPLCHFRFPPGDLCSCADFPMKYILVTGGVISGIGKGIIASSIGTILKSCGLRVTAIKIDPYINIDAGTFSPYEHGMKDGAVTFCINFVFIIMLFCLFSLKNSTMVVISHFTTYLAMQVCSVLHILKDIVC